MRKSRSLQSFVKAGLVLLIVLSLVIPGSSVISTQNTQSNVVSDTQISLDQARVLLNTKKAVLLDVLDTEDRTSTIKGAFVVTLLQLECGSCLEKMLKTYDFLVVYSEDASMRSDAAALLKNNGYTVYELTDVAASDLSILDAGSQPAAFPNDRYYVIQPSTTDQLVGVYEHNGQIERLYGTTFSHGQTPQESADNFLRSNAELLGVHVEDLRFQTLQPIMYENGQYKFTGVFYTQYNNNIPVYDTRLVLLVKNEENYPLVLASVNLRDLREATFQITPEMLNTQKAITSALEVAPRLTTFTAPEMIIWAGTDYEKTTPAIAYTFVGDNGLPADGSTPEKYRFVTDATSGNVLYKENMILFVDVNGRVQGKATTGKAADFCEEELAIPLKWARVGIGTTYAYTDGNGNFVIPNAGTTQVTVDSPLRGRWFTVTNYSGVNTILHLLVIPPGPANFMHNNLNLNEYYRAEVNGYVQANVVRDFTLTYNPSYPGLQQNEFPVYVNRADGYCPGNAWYDYSSINFCRSGGGYPNTAWSTVIHHEYGHHLVNMAGSGQEAYGEGMGDVMGMLITDDAGTGYGFYGVCETPLRNAVNTIQYPCSGEIHYCGQLLSGCVWETRNELAITNPTTYLSIISNLAVNAMLLHSGSNIDPSITIDYLTLDDDNGDIYDGTPHYNEIATGFGEHNMDAPPLNLLSFSFPNGLPDLINPIGGTTIRVIVSGVSAQPQPGTGKIYINTGSGYQQTAMTQIEPNVYDAVFPSVPCLTQVSYYFSAQTTGGQTQYCPNDAPQEVFSTISAGSLETTFTDNFQLDLGWTVQNQGISTGAWQRGIPACGGGRGDPPSDYDGSGYCYVTDNRCSDYDIDGGYTWLISPTMDLSGYDDAKISYAVWYTNDYGANPNNNYFKTYVSNNNGGSWVLAETIGPATPQPYDWYVHEFVVSDYVTLTNQMKVRFEASDVGSGAVVEAGIDAVSASVIRCDVSVLLLAGDCFYGDMSPVTTLDVEAMNLQTGERWQATTMNNHYSLLLSPDDDVSAGQTLRVTARDRDESVNITEYTVTEDDIIAAAITLDLVLNIHYRDLKAFPYYLAVWDSGAMVMKMMMDYLMWNSTTHPNGPPSVYSELALYNAYKGPDSTINGSELAGGLNNEIDDHAHGWIYGYFFNPAYSTDASEVLKQICIWLDYPVDYYNENRPVDVPKPGHPNHVPIAVPTQGNYNNWMVVRGIHTDRNAWLPPTDLTVYGFWLNSPVVPVGDYPSENTYVTVSRFLSNYFTALSVPGDYFDGQYLAITDPYQGFDERTLDTIDITVATTPSVLTSTETQFIQHAQQSKPLSALTGIAQNIIVRAAFEQTMDVLKYDQTTFSEAFAHATLSGKPVFKNGEYAVVFKSSNYLFNIILNRNAVLQEIQIQ